MLNIGHSEYQTTANGYDNISVERQPWFGEDE